MRRLLITAIAACAALAAIPAAASAAGPACSYTAITHSLDVGYMDNTPAAAKVTVQLSGSNFQVLDATGTALTCTGIPATTANTDVIDVTDNGPAGHNTILSLNERTGAFLGGFTAEPTGGSEIEVQYAAGDGTDQLLIDGTDNADNWLFGQTGAGVVGANLNADDDGNDIMGTGVEKADINGGKGDDQISAIGNAALAPIANPLVLSELILEGGNQNDLLRGGAGNDKLFGGTQDDDVNGGGGNDTLDGGSDNDSLDGGVGADTMIGNTGIDFATYADQTSSVNVSLDGAANDGGAPDFFQDNVSTDVENVKGGSASDIITGSPLDNELTGNGGNDTVSGAFGNDKVSGSAGADRLLGGTGNDRLFGGSENDNMVGAAGNDKLQGDSGKDIFLGRKGFDRLLAKDGIRDKKLDCGPGKSKGESFTRDHKDPKPKSC